MTASYDWRKDARDCYDLAIRQMRLRLVASGVEWWRDCVEMYAWEGAA